MSFSIAEDQPSHHAKWQVHGEKTEDDSAAILAI
jgi:hypothetical protein